MRRAQVRRNYKDSLFRMVFREKQELLSLYNAINGSSYENPESLEINTIEDYIYMGLKNDVSFLLDCHMNLYEAQSTLNPNMPLRGLFYLSNLYQGYVESRRMDIYSTIPLKIPVPRYIVLYNGTKEETDRREMKLSDSYIGGDGRDYSLECTAVLLNINFGHNKEIMEKCRRLYEYSYLVEEVRRYLKAGCTLEEAMDVAVSCCIEEGILEDFLRKHRGEVKDLILSKYDEEFHIKCEKELSFQEGKEEGRTEGKIEGKAEGEEKKLIQMVCKKLEKGKDPHEIAEDLEEEYEVIARICDTAKEQAPDYDCDKIYEELHK